MMAGGQEMQGLISELGGAGSDLERVAALRCALGRGARSWCSCHTDRAPAHAPWKAEGRPLVEIARSPGAARRHVGCKRWNSLDFRVAAARGEKKIAGVSIWLGLVRRQFIKPNR